MCIYHLNNALCLLTSQSIILELGSSFLCNIQGLRINLPKESYRLNTIGFNLLTCLSIISHRVVVARHQKHSKDPTDSSSFADKSSDSLYTSRSSQASSSGPILNDCILVINYDQLQLFNLGILTHKYSMSLLVVHSLFFLSAVKHLVHHGDDLAPYGLQETHNWNLRHSILIEIQMKGKSIYILEYRKSRIIRSLESSINFLLCGMYPHQLALHLYAQQFFE